MASCDAALHLFSPVQPQFQLYKTGTQERPNWVLSQAPAPSPQLLTMGQAMPRLPSEAPLCAMGRAAGLGHVRASQPAGAAQHSQSLLQHCCLGSCARNGFGCFPLLELPESGAKWQLPRCPGSCSIWRDELGTAGAFVLTKEKAKRPDLKNQPGGGQELLPGPELSADGRGVADCSSTSGSHHSSTSSGKALGCSHTDLAFGSKQTRTEHLQIFYRNFTFSLTDKISLSGLLFFNQNNLKHFRNVLCGPAPDASQHPHSSSSGPSPAPPHCVPPRWMQPQPTVAGEYRTCPWAVPSCPPNIFVVWQLRAKPFPSSCCLWFWQCCQRPAGYSTGLPAGQDIPAEPKLLHHLCSTGALGGSAVTGLIPSPQSFLVPLPVLCWALPLSLQPPTLQVPALPRLGRNPPPSASLFKLGSNTTKQQPGASKLSHQM